MPLVDWCVHQLHSSERTAHRPAGLCAVVHCTQWRASPLPQDSCRQHIRAALNDHNRTSNSPRWRSPSILAITCLDFRWRERLRQSDSDVAHCRSRRHLGPDTVPTKRRIPIHDRASVMDQRRRLYASSGMFRSGCADGKLRQTDTMVDGFFTPRQGTCLPGAISGNEPA
jgi:hypothetical protein